MRPFSALEKTDSLSTVLNLLLDLSAAIDTSEQSDPPLHPLRVECLRLCTLLDCIQPDRLFLPCSVKSICVCTICSLYWCPPGLGSGPPHLSLHQFLCSVISSHGHSSLQCNYFSASAPPSLFSHVIPLFRILHWFPAKACIILKTLVLA